MLTRLRVKGFKNLVDVDVRFGPFTCIAGPNGAGKSNLFDAILFLRELADKSFVEAANSIRGGDDPALLFTAGTGEMTLLAEMVIPPEGTDEFGQRAKASSTFVEYELRLRRSQNSHHGSIELVSEKLHYVKKGEARSRLGFPHKKVWRDGVVRQTRYGARYISTNLEEKKVRRHQDRMPLPEKESGGGRALEYDLASLPRTVLSSARNAQESRTAVLVRREMQSWRALQLEPAAMRQPDDIRAPDRIDHDGSHLPATLYRLVNTREPGSDAKCHETRILAQISNRVAELIQGVETVSVIRDDDRKLFRLMMRETGGAELPAASLSDGTLRFLALALMELDPEEVGVICLEEPENGMHPSRIEAMLRLLQDIAVDPNEPASSDNPLRQVIVNTHSPVVVGLVPEEALLFAQPLAQRLNSTEVSGLVLRCIKDTWRSRDPNSTDVIARGDVRAYLSPLGSPQQQAPLVPSRTRRRPPGPRRVKDYVDQFILDL